MAGIVFDYKTSRNIDFHRVCGKGFVGWKVKHKFGIKKQYKTKQNKTKQNKNTKKKKQQQQQQQTNQQTKQDKKQKTLSLKYRLGCTPGGCTMNNRWMNNSNNIKRI